MSYPDQATASIAQFLFRDSAGAMYIIPRRAFHNGSEYGDTVTLVQDLSGNGNDLTGTAVFDRRSFYGGNRPLDNVRDAQFIRDVNMSAPVSGTGTTIRAVPGGAVTFDEGALDGAITGEFSVLILIDRTLSEREKHVVSELARLWGGANWTPGALFMAGKDGIWLDPSDHSTLWIDEERTQNATQPGDVVWWIDDKSGNENHFSVDASANRSRLVRWPASAVREGRVRNLFFATSMVGASVPNTLPTGWSIMEISAGLAYEVAGMGVEDGFDYIDVRFHGIPGGTGRTTIQHMPGDASISTGDITYTTRARLVGGTGEGVTTFRKSFILSNGTNRSIGDFDISTGGTLAAREYSVTFSDPSVTAIRGGFSFSSEAGQPVDFTVRLGGMQLEQGDTPTPYQRVGAGHWDVTEEGQPDCWGIEANGINNRYVSERGIPEYVDGKVRMLVGQTKQRPDGTSNGTVFTNQPTGNTNNGYAIVAHLTGNRSYFARYRSSSNTIVNTGGEYPSPHTGILDVAVSSGDGSLSLRVNSDGPLSATGTSGSIGDTPMMLFKYPAQAGNNYEGILWGLILPNYEPDETLWDRVARDWLNSTNMPGVLSDDD